MAMIAGSLLTRDAKFVVYKSKTGWRWKLVAPNNEIVALSGEPFETRGNAKRAIKRVRQYGVLASIEVKEPK